MASAAGRLPPPASLCPGRDQTARAAGAVYQYSVTTWDGAGNRGTGAKVAAPL